MEQQHSQRALLDCSGKLDEQISNSVEIQKVDDDTMTFAENFADPAPFADAATDEPQKPKRSDMPRLGDATAPLDLKASSGRKSEPEPVPIFSCIYCVKEFLVFTNLSNRILSHKYARPRCANIHSSQPTDNATKSQRKSESLSFGNEKSQERPRALTALGGDRSSISELRLPAAPEPKDIASLTREEAVQRLGELAAARVQGVTVVVPLLSEGSASLRWLLHKYYIAKKDRVTKGATTFYDKSLSSNTNLRSSMTRQQSVKMSELDGVTQSVETRFINLENGDDIMPDTNKHAADWEHTSFSSSEHDIYAPSFDSSSASSESDRDFLERALCQTRALRPSPASNISAGEFLKECEADLGEAKGRMPTIPEAFMVSPLDGSAISSNDSKFIAKIRVRVTDNMRSGYASAENSSLATPFHAVSAQQFAMVPDSTYTNPLSHSRHESDTTPNISAQNCSTSNILLGLTQSVTNTSHGKNSPMSKCVSVQQLLKRTRNPNTTVQESRTGHGRRIAGVPPGRNSCRNPPPVKRPKYLDGVRRPNPQKRLVHYDAYKAVFQKKMSGIQFPLFVRSSMPTPSMDGARSARPSTAAAGCELQGLHKNRDQIFQAIRGELKSVGVTPLVSARFGKTIQTRSVITGAVVPPVERRKKVSLVTRCDPDPAARRRTLNKCTTSYKPIKLDLICAHKYFEGTHCRPMMPKAKKSM